MFEANQAILAGTGHSDFQAKPLPQKRADGSFDVRTDWEDTLVRSMEGGPKRIAGDLSRLPDFDRDYRKQMDRCADDIHNKAFRMSLDFGRLCPNPTGSAPEFDEKLMAQYIRKIAYCRKKKMEPLVTLHHWPMSLWLCEKKGDRYKKGAWEHPDVLKHFEFYIKKIIEFLFNPKKIRHILEEDADFTPEEIDEMLNDGSIVRTLITINEPMCHYLLAYWGGQSPPFQNGRFRKGRKVLETAGEAHHIAYQEIHNAVDRIPDLQNQVRLGVAYNFIYFEGAGWLTRKIANRLDRSLNLAPLEVIERNPQSSDFLGIQYYHRQDVSSAELWRKISGKDSRPDRQYSDHPGFGDIYPEGIKKIIEKVKELHPEKVLKVTEIGFADKVDKRRPFWIMETVRYILEAKEQGADIDMIILWSLINNLEWNSGMEVEFGTYDHKCDRHANDDGSHISTRMVWSTLSTYLNHPTKENRAAVLALYELAKQQYESVIIR